MKTLRITDCGIASRGKLVTRGLPFDLSTRLRRLRRGRKLSGYQAGQNHQGITLRSLQNLPVSFCGASEANQTTPAAPSRTERVAFEPPISVRTQPGHTEFNANFGK